MKSSFEDKVQSDGTYKMEILSKNINVFDIDKFINENALNKYLNGFDCNFYQEKILHSQFKRNTRYVIRCDYNIYDDRLNVGWSPILGIQFEDGLRQECYLHQKNYLVTTTGNRTIKYIYIRNPWKAYTYIYNISIHENINEFGYIEPKQNKIQFLSMQPLRGVDNVKDRFIFKDGKLMIERNCDEVILNGSENWRISPTFTQLVNNHTIYYDFPTADKFNNNNYLNGLCNKFKVVNGSDFVNDAESIVLSTAWWDTTKRCSLRVRRSKLSSTNLNSFKEWLSENPIKVVYDLSEPTYEEIPYELQKIILEGYENGTLFFDTNIPPTATVTYAGEAPIVSAVKSTRTNVLSNTDDINDNIVPYLMDMDYRVVCLQLADNTESISVARLLGSTYEMLQRDIQSKRYPVDEYKHRLDAYLEVKKITEEEYIKLGEMLNE